MRCFGKFAAAFIAAASLSLSAIAAVDNHGSVVYTSATCNVGANSVTVFGTNQSSSSAGFVANVTVNGGAVFQSPIVFDGTPGAIPANSSGSFTFTNALFTNGAVVVLTNNFGGISGPGVGSTVTAVCGAAAPPLQVPALSSGGLAGLLLLLSIAGFAAFRMRRR